MPFVKGQSGNPGGKTGDKLVHDMLLLAALVKNRNGTTRLRRMADKVMIEAVKGRQWAVQFVADRLDGKVPQPVQQTADVNVTNRHIFLDLYQRVSNGEFNRKLIDDDAAADHTE